MCEYLKGLEVQGYGPERLTEDDLGNRIHLNAYNSRSRVHMARASNAEPLHNAMKRIGMDVEYCSGTVRSTHQPSSLIQHPQDMLPLNTFK